jgi:hypothetical protein
MTQRPDSGYRALARIETRSSRRRQLSMAVLVLVIGAWAGSSVYGWATGSSAPGRGAEPSDRGASRASTEASAPIGATLDPVPPAFEVLGAPAPSDPIAVRLGGLAWLEPERGEFVLGPDPEWRQMLFQEPEGHVLCVCFEPSGDGAADSLHVQEYGPVQGVLRETLITPWMPRAAPEGLVFDAVPTEDGAAAIVATAVASDGGWALSLSRIGIDAGQQTIAVLDRVPDADVGAGLPVELRVWLAPDGGHARVRFSTAPDGPFSAPRPDRTWSWLVAIKPDGFRVMSRPKDPFPELDGTRCPAEAFATASVFVRVCRQPLPDGGGEEVVVRRERLDGGHDVLSLPVMESDDSIGWAIDARAGVVYGWAASAHRAYRVDASDGSFAFRDVDVYEGANGLAKVTLEAPPPPVRPEPAQWQALVSGAQSFPGPLVGSPDGSVVYAAGTSFGISESGGPGSTGIWVLDANTLAIVDHWAPAAVYTAIGLSSDGQWLLAEGPPPSAEVDAYGSHGPTLVIHETSFGGPVRIVMRRLVIEHGGVPYFLSPSAS